MEIKRSFGHYEMVLRFKGTNEIAQVAMYDISEKLPLVWSRIMACKEAHSALSIFESIGFYNVV